MVDVYSNYKFINFPEHLDSLRVGKVVAPVHVRIKPTNRCNHDCWYCAYRNSNVQLGDDMDELDQIAPDKMSEIVDDIISLGVKAVTFSGGGEPLLYKPLPNIIKRLAEGGVLVASLTNGSNLKGLVAEAFALHGTWVRVSLDAWDDESYSEARSVGIGEFSKLIDNLRRFSELGSQCELGVSFIISQENHTQIAEVCGLLKDAGVNHVKLSGVVVGDSAEKINAHHDAFRESASAEIEKAMAMADESFSVINHYHETAERFDREYKTCPYLIFLTVIGADSTVYTCQDKAYTQSGALGSILDRSFKSFWFSEENLDKLFGLDPSQECPHHCVAHKKNLALTNLLSLDPNHALFV